VVQGHERLKGKCCLHPSGRTISFSLNMGEHFLKNYYYWDILLLLGFLLLLLLFAAAAVVVFPVV
jgi:hypothetical protein